MARFIYHHSVEFSFKSNYTAGKELCARHLFPVCFFIPVGPLLFLCPLHWSFQAPCSSYFLSMFFWPLATHTCAHTCTQFTQHSHSLLFKMLIVRTVLKLAAVSSACAKSDVPVYHYHQMHLPVGECVCVFSFVNYVCIMRLVEECVGGRQILCFCGYVVWIVPSISSESRLISIRAQLR